MTNNKQGIKWYNPAFLIATWFGIGKMPFAPGTWGSLFTFPLFIASHFLLIYADSKEEFINLYLVFVGMIFLIGMWATKIYMDKTGRHDPKEVVIDEVAGQILVFFAAFVPIAESLGIFNAFYESDVNTASAEFVVQVFTDSPIAMPYIIASSAIYLICFILFRIFDIWKPWPIGFCDKNIKGSFGVMFDDLFAAMYAIVALYCIWLLISYIGF